MRLIFFLGIWLFIFACDRELDVGSLVVKAPLGGSYEIYRIDESDSLHFKSEQLGFFNQELQLAPGNYLILADCSYKQLIIHAKESQTIYAHAIHFVPPRQTTEQDYFSIRCTRYEKTNFTQLIKNRYSLVVLNHDIEILVAMVPFKHHFETPKNQNEVAFSQSASFYLSSLLVAYHDNAKHFPFFVSPSNKSLALTEGIEQGRWLYLLPGHYSVFLNGSSLDFDLQEKEQKTIEPSFIRISTPEKVSAESLLSDEESYFIRINDSHLIESNEILPVLGENLSVKFFGSIAQQVFPLEKGKINEFSVNRLLVDSGCSPFEWECHKKRAVFLYNDEDENHTLINENLTDTSILYTQKNILVEVEGSKGIYLKVQNKKDTQLSLGRISFAPKTVFKKGFYTDLVRIEPLDKGFTGFSHDIVPNRLTTMTLVEGSYVMVKYTDGPLGREPERKIIRLKKNDHIKVPFVYFVPPSKKNLAHSKVLENTTVGKVKDIMDYQKRDKIWR